MGQKANTLTLRTNTNKLESYASNSKTFLNTNEYINTLKRSLEKKNVIIISHSFNATTDTFNLSLNLFFKTRKVQKYLRKKFKVNLLPRIYRSKKKFYWRAKSRKAWLKRKKKKIDRVVDSVSKEQKKINFFSLSKRRKRRTRLSRKKAKKLRRLRKKRISMKGRLRNKRRKKNFLTKKAFKHAEWTKTLSTLTKNLPSNNLVIQKITLLNKQVNIKIVRIINSKLKFFKKMLFSRRFDLYYDFLKLTSLLITKKLKIGVYNVILGKIFKFLTKKSHNKFFNFLKKIAHLVTRSSTIGGIKFGINGKLKGKLRAKSFKLEVGKIGVQTITSDIDFSKVHINTLYGCFGLKTWIKYN